MSRRNVFTFAGIGIGAVSLSFFLAWFSQDFATAAGWAGFLASALIALLLGWAAFAHLRGEELPDWMPWLVLGAVLFRLALGVFWFYALPKWGYPTDQQQAGYIMYDPFLRDNHAWELAQSGEPLIEAFKGYSANDQYGGMLFISAWMYRYLGGDLHLPQLVLVLTSAVSGIGVAYVWAFTRRMWGQQAAKWAAIGLAVYPEAVLLGGAHMREAFTIPLGVALGFLLVRFWQDRRRLDIGVFLLLFAITLAISWAYVLLLLMVMGLFLVGLWVDQRKGKPLSAWQWGAVTLGGVGAVFLSKVFWDLLSQMNEFQSGLTETYSGIIQAVFDRIPAALHTPFLVVYGMVRPLLPAALLGKGNSWLWRALGIYRAIGWTVVLALLLYATLLVIRKKAWFSSAGMLLWGSWLVSIIAAYRAGGDLWDNPRYRAGFAAFQLGLAAWAVAEQKARRDPLLQRVLVSAGLIIFWVVIWYLPRYTAVPWRSGTVLSKVGVGLMTSGLYLLWDWVRLRAKDAP
ncbi:MAG: hypothetical protein P8046_03550 [Anaerolineales bacterium]